MDNGMGGSGADATAIWCNSNTIDLTQFTQVSFNIRFGNVAQADGITFTMHRDPAGFGAIGSGGGWLGVTNSWGGPGLNPSVNVEFDIFDNTLANADISVDHVAISYNGALNAPVTGPAPIPLVNNTWHQMVVTWDPCIQTLTVTMDGNVIATRVDDLVNNVFGGIPNGIIFGFTSATQSSNTTHDLCFTNLVQEPTQCCTETIESIQKNCSDFTFTLTANNVNAVGQVWTVDGVNAGSSPTLDVTLTPGGHEICVHYFGPQINNPDNICCETVCDSVTALADTTYYCRDTVKVPCGRNLDLDLVIPKCAPCDTMHGAVTGSWIDLATGTAVSNPLLNITLPGIYQRETTDAAGCTKCVKEVHVNVTKPVVSFTFNIFPNCPCSTLTSSDIDALMNSVNPGGCPLGETVFNVIELDAGGNFVSSFTVDPLHTGSFCDGMNYMIRPDDSLSCCEVRMYVICASGLRPGQSGTTVMLESNDAMFQQHFPAPGQGTTGLSADTPPVVGMDVMPNPAREYFKLGLHAVGGVLGTVSIYSGNGQLMQQTRLTGGQENTTLQVGTSEWAAGIYVIYWRHSNGALIESGKVTVTK